MLVLKVTQGVIITTPDGWRIEVKPLDGACRMGFEAAEAVKILRSELEEESTDAKP